MASRFVHRLLTSTALMAGLLICTPSFAQGPDKQTAARVLRLVKDANDEFDRGEFDDALELYQEAYNLYPDPVLLYRIGLSADKHGDARRAVAAYQAFVDAAKSDDATAQQVAARITELKATIPPRVTITSDPAGAEVYVGSVDAPSLGQTPGAFELPAGEVLVIVRLEGYRLEKQALTLQNGDEETIGVKLVKLKRLSGGDPPPEEPGDSSGPRLGTYGWITAGVGVALLGTGATFAILSASTTSKVNDYDKRAPGASRAELDDLKDRATSQHKVAVATLAAGGVVTAVGATLILIDVLGSSPDESARLLPAFGSDGRGGWVGFTGRF